MNEVNERLKELRLALNLSQEELGKMLGITRSGVSDIESGRRKVTEQHIIMLKIGRPDVNETWLRTGEGEMFKETPSSELDALADRYGLGNPARALVERFVTLKPEEQEVIIRFVRNAAADIEKLNPSSSSPEQKHELTIDEKLEIIRQQLEIEEKVKAESSALNGTEETEGKVG